MRCLLLNELSYHKAWCINLLLFKVNTVTTATTEISEAFKGRIAEFWFCCMPAYLCNKLASHIVLMNIQSYQCPLRVQVHSREVGAAASTHRSGVLI